MSTPSGQVPPSPAETDDSGAPLPDDAVVIGVGVPPGSESDDALESFLASIPEDFPHAVVVQRDKGAPVEAGRLVRRLRQVCPRPVAMAHDGQVIRAGHVHLCPVDAAVLIHRALDSHQQGVFRLSVRSAQEVQGGEQPLDLLLGSLAAVMGERGVGMLLGGASGKGTMGLREIKRRGGMVLVDHPTSAGRFGSAVGAPLASLIDRVSPAEHLLRGLQQVLRLRTTFGDTQEDRSGDPDIWESLPETGGNAPIEEAYRKPLTEYRGSLEMLLRFLSGVTNIDFTCFKRATAERGVLRRMALCQCETLSDYISLLSRTEEEIQHLQSELLIGVTGFFRDPAAWNALRDKGLRRLLDGKDLRPVTIWVAACSTGEEVYSLAMLLDDLLTHARLRRPFRIVATDVQASALRVAQTGIYPRSALSDIPPEYHLSSLLIDNGATFEIAPRLKRLVTFLHHDMLRDPAVVGCDLILCRNALMYYDTDTQVAVLDHFLDALRPHGLLFLGNAEYMPTAARGFRPILGSARLLQSLRTEADQRTSRQAPRLPTPGYKPRPKTLRPDIEARLVRSELGEILRKLDAAVFLITPEAEILRTFGRYDRFLQMPTSGSFSNSLLDLLPEPLSSRVGDMLRSTDRDEYGACVAVPRDESETALLVDGFCHLPNEPKSETAYVVILRPHHGNDQHAHRTSLDTIDRLTEEVDALNEMLASTYADMQDTYEMYRAAQAQLEKAELELAQATSATAEHPAQIAASFEPPLVAVDEDLAICWFNPAFAALVAPILPELTGSLVDLLDTVHDGLGQSLAVMQADQEASVQLDIAETCPDWSGWPSTPSPALSALRVQPVSRAAPALPEARNVVLFV